MPVLRRWERLRITTESRLQAQLIVSGGLVWFALFNALEHPGHSFLSERLSDIASYIALVKILFVGLVLGCGSLILSIVFLIMPFVFLHRKLDSLYGSEKVIQPYYMYTTYLLLSNVCITVFFLVVLLVRT